VTTSSVRPPGNTCSCTDQVFNVGHSTRWAIHCSDSMTLNLSDSHGSRLTQLHSGKYSHCSFTALVTTRDVNFGSECPWMLMIGSRHVM
jgi:hypothetical protein